MTLCHFLFGVCLQWGGGVKCYKELGSFGKEFYLSPGPAASATWNSSKQKVMVSRCGGHLGPWVTAREEEHPGTSAAREGSISHIDQEAVHDCVLG